LRQSSREGEKQEHQAITPAAKADKSAQFISTKLENSLKKNKENNKGMLVGER